MKISRRGVLKLLGGGVPVFPIVPSKRSLGQSLNVAPIPNTSSEVRTLQLYPDRTTVLMGSDAYLKGSLKIRWPDQTAKRFWVENWISPNDSFTWTVNAPRSSEYLISMIVVSCPKAIVNCMEPSSPVEVEIASGSRRLTHWIKYRDTSPLGQWNREYVAGTLPLNAGVNTIRMRALNRPEKGAMNLALFSIELVQPDVKARQDQEAAELRSSTGWMADAKYGLMFHWNTRSQPREGTQQPYYQAVQKFDVSAFADMVQRTGAGYVVFVTTWADYYFPAPIQAIDRILPGRTCDRDLPSDLADALNERGINLMLYYHPGHDDKAWWDRTGFNNVDKAEFFDRWCSIISEIGERYGKRLAGFWFDDGILTYYPFSAPWERMTRAAKAGNADRVVAYNPWILPKATDFQDFFCGEGDLIEGQITGEGFLPIGGTGIYTGGPQAGLQATITTPNERGNWCHDEPHSPIPLPRYSTIDMINKFKECIVRRNIPVINLEVYQDGTPSGAALEEFDAIRKAFA